MGVTQLAKESGRREKKEKKRAHTQTDEKRKRKRKSGGAHPINICLLLRKAQMSQTLLLHFLQQIVSEEGLDGRVLERLVVRVLFLQSLDVFIGQEAGGEVLGAWFCSGFLGAAFRFGGRRRGIMAGGGGGGGGGIMCDLLPLWLRGTGSGAAFSIRHDEISEVGKKKVVKYERGAVDRLHGRGSERARKLKKYNGNMRGYVVGGEVEEPF